MSIQDVSSNNDFFLSPDRSGAKRKSTNEEAKGSDLLNSKASSSKADASSSSSLANSHAKPAHEPKTTKKTEFFNHLEKANNSSQDERFNAQSKPGFKEAPIQKRPDMKFNPYQEQNDKDESFNFEKDFSVKTDRVGVKSPVSAQGQSMVQNGPQMIDDSVNQNELDEQVQAIQILAQIASPQFNVKSLTPQELKEIKDVLKESQAQIKQESVQNFMGQMQTQFGVTPDKIVQAFAKMDQKTLEASPSQTITNFLDNLGVKTSERSQVAKLYQKMLNETGEAAFNEKMLQDTDGKDLNLNLIDSTESKLEQLNKSLDTLNQSFFAKPQKDQKIPQSIQEQLKNLAAKNSSATKSEDKNDNQNIAGMMPQKSNSQLSSPSSLMSAIGLAAAGVASASSAPAKSMMNLNNDSMGEDSLSEKELSELNINSINADAKSLATNSNLTQSAIQPQESTQEFLKNFNQALNAKQGPKNIPDGTKEALKNVNTKSTESITSAKDSSSNADVLAQMTSNPTAGAVGAASAAGTTAAALSPDKMMLTGANKQESAENVKELINQAQVIIKKGGGEMNVEMKPEGMGQVHLKVAVENGQVNIQMMAQNEKVKKMLDEGLHDLKTSLAAHKLQVEALKVGIAQGSLNESSLQQKQQDAQREMLRDAQREFASNFMGQMRDENQNSRSGFTEIPGWKSYRNEPKRVNVEAQTDGVQTRKRQEGRRLSVMA